MEGFSTITGNELRAGGGAGVRVQHPAATAPPAGFGTIRMYGSSSITNNIAFHSGGGVQLNHHSTLYMLGNGVRISGNQAGGYFGSGTHTSQGGGVALTQVTANLRIWGGKIYGIVDRITLDPGIHPSAGIFFPPVPPGTAIGANSFNCTRALSNTARHWTPTARFHALLIGSGSATFTNSTGTTVGVDLWLGPEAGISSDIEVMNGTLMSGPLFP